MATNILENFFGLFNLLSTNLLKSGCLKIWAITYVDFGDQIVAHIKSWEASRLLNKLAIDSPENAGDLCDYIISEQTEINIKQSTMFYNGIRSIIARDRDNVKEEYIR
jgi:hypothetical protein